MKTVEQVTRYLSSCVLDDDSWEKVLSFCREQYGGGKAHRPRRGQYPADFTDFLTWFKYLPGQGDIVKVGSVVGVVGQCTPSVYTLCAYIGQNGQLTQKELKVFPHHIVFATPEETKAFNDKLFHARIAYSIKLGTLTQLYIPDDSDFVVVKHHNSLQNGIFMAVRESEYCFYFLDGKNATIKPVSIPCSECEIEGATSKESLELLERLSHLGVMWDVKSKQFLPIPKKVNLGDKYWYINDKFYVCQDKDMQTPTHKERYKNGNYFTSYAEALVFLKRLKDLCKELNKGLDL